ncbi:MAG: PAS domain S-box protein [Deltaproteobacteria bacterium]|nr:PAS domain S-box protein [Deltaproteobacteria bacterium]
MGQKVKTGNKPEKPAVRKSSADMPDLSFLNSATELLEKFFSAPHLHIALLDRNYNFICVNALYAKTSGYSSAFLKGKNHFELFPDKGNEAIFRRVVDTGEAFSAFSKPFTYPEFPERGITYWDWTVQPIKDASGQVVSLLFILVNITESKKTEERLDNQFRFLQTLMDTIPSPIYYKDTDCRYLGCNNAFEEIVLKKREEIEGKTLFDFMPSKQAEELHRMDVELLKKGGTQTFEMVIEFPDHAMHDMLFQKATYNNSDGSLAGLVGMAIDISERKKTEKALMSERNKLINILEAMPDGVYISDDKYTVQYANPVIKKEFGALNDQKCYEYFHCLNVPCAWCRNEEVFSGKTVRTDAVIQGKVYDIIETPLKNPDGSISKIDILRDITEKKRMEEELLRHRDHLEELVRTRTLELTKTNEKLKKEISERNVAEKALKDSEEKYHNLIEFANDAIILADAETGIIIDVNRKATQLLGMAREKMIGLHQSQLHPAEESEYYKKVFKNHIKLKELTKSNLFVSTKDGRRVPVDISASLTEINGRMVFQGIFHDITERLNSEEQIKKSLKEKEALLSEIHHRVKNNLQIISSLLRIQSRYIKDSRDREIFNESENRIKSMAVIHEELYRSKDFSEIDISDYISHLMENLFHSYGVDTAIIKLKLDIEPVNLSLDTAIPCGLIINELVSNALKYAFPDNKKGEVAISLKKSDGGIRLEVTDNGIGMPDGFDIAKAETLGLQLVNSLLSQLHGYMDIITLNGTRISLYLQDQTTERRNYA